MHDLVQLRDGCLEQFIRWMLTFLGAVYAYQFSGFISSFYQIFWFRQLD